MSRILVVWFCAAPAFAETPAELLRQGNAAYRAGKYAEAVDRYQRAIDAGARAADVHHNLGTAYYRLGRTGQAILHFEKALALQPRHEDARVNLSIARRRAGLEKAEQELGLPQEGFWRRLARRVTTDEVAVVFLVLYYLFFGALVARHLLRPGPARSLMGLAALSLLALVLAVGGFFAYRVHIEERFVDGVLLEEKVALMEPHGGQWKSVRSLPEGLRVRVLSRSEKWVQVRLPGGLSGYVRREQVGEI